MKVFFFTILQELCKNGGILSLARAVLKLNIPQHFNESITIVAAISRWKSKVLSIVSPIIWFYFNNSFETLAEIVHRRHFWLGDVSINNFGLASYTFPFMQLLQLCETESISYLDEVASSPRSMDLAKSVALEVSSGPGRNVFHYFCFVLTASFFLLIEM